MGENKMDFISRGSDQESASKDCKSVIPAKALPFRVKPE
jgi:hypothetical protein